MTNPQSYLKERTNLRTTVVSLLVLFVGFTLLVISEAIDFIANKSWLKSIVANFGGLLVATISIALLWELFSKRAFLMNCLPKLA